METDNLYVFEEGLLGHYRWKSAIDDDSLWLFVEDAMENASLTYLNELMVFSREQDLQLIIPILYDRIQNLDTSDEDVVLYLSKSDKLFKI